MKFVKKALKLSLIVPLSVMLCGCGRTKVNLNDYLTIDCEGYDTVGTADYTFDIEEVIADNPEAFGLEEDYSEKKLLKVVADLEDEFEGELDKTENLSNGDTVTFKWDKNIKVDDIEDSYPVKLEISDKTLTVDSLDAPEEFDPFENITVSYSGIAPNGTLKIKYGSGADNFSFEADKTEGLSNGDKVKITVEPSYYYDYDSLEEYCLSIGKVPTATEKEYTVEGLSGYATALADIPEDALTKMDSHAQDCLKAHIAKKWAKAETFKGMSLVGNYFVTPKDSSIYTSDYNYLYFVYKVTATNADENKDFTYYYYSYYPNIMILDDGTCSFDLNDIVTPSDSFSTGSYYYYGYQDINSLFNKQITAKIDSYNYESNIEE